LKLYYNINKFLLIAFTALLADCTASAQKSDSTNFVADKVRGLFYGTLFGDALGGPIEFQGHPEIQATPNPPKLWKEGELMNEEEKKNAINRLYLREYKYLRPVPEPYAHWSSLAAPGTVTDDSRHKIILMHMLREAVKNKLHHFTPVNMANAYRDWPVSESIQKRPGYDTLCKQWLQESDYAINWLLGNRNLGQAYPLERLWNALPTCYGQMTLPPLAALYPGKPIEAYMQAYEIAYFDNGFAKDMNAALVAALSVALTIDANKKNHKEIWQQIKQTIKQTDPFNYSMVPWSDRATSKWLDLADQFAADAKGSPYALFQRLEKELLYDVKWEAHVPFVVMFSCLHICDYEPLAALQLSIEWGWDHDSYAQLLGAFIGAIYGTEIFKKEWKETISLRLKADYNEDIEEWVRVTENLRKLQTKK
jgi:ADP-ribosylglycohydrolase